MKNKSLIEFEINEEKKFVIDFFEPLSNIDGCYDIKIFFVDGDMQFIVDDDTAAYIFDGLIILLEKVLNSKVLLHDSIDDKIGYLLTQYRFYSFNKTLLKNYNIVYNEKGNWVGWEHLLWGYELTVWLYNNKKGEIILEITPWYKGPCVEDGDYTLYKKFLKEYKTYCVIKLSKNLVKQWLDKAEKVLAILAENTLIQHAEKK
jgi:hypothetical protein